ncbi:MAG: J domain-containing protein [Brevundimonas sp.]|uniref:J domain-containing protein n=1 Tax=Brevundimonas sp. TaxID=1871086 RepID=UPI00391BC92B
MGDTSAMPPPLSLAQARAVLGLDRADAPSPAAAFRAAAKASHPDRAGGDAESFRRVVEAWTVVRAADPGATRRLLPAPAPVLRLTPMQALRGGEVRKGAHLLTVPAGLRSGDWVRGPDRQRLVVLVQPADGVSLVGDDLYMDWAVDPRRLADGGRIEIDTHAGLRPAWIAPGGGTGRLRLANLGLPARGSRAQGHLFVALKPCAEAASEAEDLLLRFSRVWTPARRAA